jgi:hypothetical protein
MEKHPFEVSSRFKIVLALVGLILFVTGSFIAIDWFTYFKGGSSIYPAVAKPLVSTLCALVAFLAWKHGLEKSDFLWLALTFACIVIVDVTMSIYVYSTNAALAASIFIVGALLSIVAHIFLIIRHAKGFKFLSESRGRYSSLLSRLGFPAAFYLPIVILLLILSPYLQKVGQFWPSLVYALILTTSLWVAWEAFRRGFFPRANAWLLALGVSFWFVCELVGVVHNIQIGTLSDLAMRLTWHFYMPGILLLALSGHNYGSVNNKG